MPKDHRLANTNFNVEQEGRTLRLQSGRVSLILATSSKRLKQMGSGHFKLNSVIIRNQDRIIKRK